MRRAVAVALLAAGAAGSACAASCGPFKALPVKAPAGHCVAVVAGAAQGLRFPRSVLVTGPGSVLLTDPGGWEPARGRLLEVKVDAAGQASVRELARALDLPHGLARGPDGRVYLAESSRIRRFASPAGVPTFEPVIEGLPARGRHLLKQIAFDRQGAMLINVGAATDRCESGGASNPVPTVCAETQGESPLAAVYRLPAGATKAQPFAFGLRNSMALAVHSSGTVLQAENNIDFPDERFPAEEINVLRAGQHHGWPFCVENRKPVFGATAASCAATVAPVLTFPAHAAPMAIRYSRAWAKPGEQEALLMSWHGYRASGHRLVRYSVKPDGTPTGAPDVLVDFSWVDDQGAKRQGSPVGFDEDADGQLWIADDRNRLLLLLRKLTPGGAAPIRTDTPPPPPPR